MDHLPVMTTSAPPDLGLPDAPEAPPSLLPGFAGAVGSGFVVQLDAFAGPLMDHLPVITTSAPPALGLPDAPEAPPSLLPGFAGAVGSGFVVQLDAFAGPLDLLLH